MANLTRSEKIQLTKEIKAVESYIADLNEMMATQGERNYYYLGSILCKRWMLLGEWFFPSTITKETKYLATLIEKRNN